MSAQDRHGRIFDIAISPQQNLADAGHNPGPVHSHRTNSYLGHHGKLSAVAQNRLLLPLAALTVSATGLATGLAACGSSGPVPAGRGHGLVDVLYAGSLTSTMESKIGPAFHAATGYDFSGFAGGSDALASQIRAGIRQADVFVSASPKTDTKLMGPGPNQLLWYATFATSPLVIGYDPRGHFAHELESKPWYDVMAEPGFRLGRTDPKLDPKGKLTISLVAAAAKHYAIGDLAQMILGPPDSTSQLFPEEELIGRLQAGQLDAGFFYSTETTAAHIPTIGIDPSVDLSATYTISVLNRPAHTNPASAFVDFLLGQKGRSLLAAAGLDVTRPVITGRANAVPSSIASLHR